MSTHRTFDIQRANPHLDTLRYASTNKRPGRSQAVSAFPRSRCASPLLYQSTHVINTSLSHLRSLEISLDSGGKSLRPTAANGCCCCCCCCCCRSACTVVVDPTSITTKQHTVNTNFCTLVLQPSPPVASGPMVLFPLVAMERGLVVSEDLTNYFLLATARTRDHLSTLNPKT